jgi:predicted cupin superfamily sugar epimerase
LIDLRDASAPAEAVIEALELRPHPEGGHYRETWRDRPADGSRGAATAILFLLCEGERSHWHRVDAAELWLWQAGAPLLLRIDADTRWVLGPELAAQRLQCLDTLLLHRRARIRL